MYAQPIVRLVAIPHTLQEDEYHGEVKNPAYCSWYERLVGFTKGYDPEWLASHREMLLKYVNAHSAPWLADYAVSFGRTHLSSSHKRCVMYVYLRLV
jgi:hypothetical protein